MWRHYHTFCEIVQTINNDKEKTEELHRALQARQYTGRWSGSFSLPFRFDILTDDTMYCHCKAENTENWKLVKRYF